MSVSGDHYPNPNAHACGNDIVYTSADLPATSPDVSAQPQVTSEQVPERAAGFLLRARQIATTILENAGRDYIARLHDPNRLP